MVNFGFVLSSWLPYCAHVCFSTFRSLDTIYWLRLRDYYVGMLFFLLTFVFGRTLAIVEPPNSRDRFPVFAALYLFFDSQRVSAALYPYLVRRDSVLSVYLTVGLPSYRYVKYEGLIFDR